MIDWESFIAFLKEMGIWNFFNRINAICMNYLGIDESKFPTIERYERIETHILNDILSPEFDKEKPNASVPVVVWFKMRRYFANRWKQRMVYKESLLDSFFTESIAHLRRFSIIKN